MIIIGNKNTKEFYVDENPVKEIYDNDTGELLWYYGEEPVPVPVEPEYFYVENSYSGQNTLTISIDSSSTPAADTYAKKFEWSKDDETWTTESLENGDVSIQLSEGEKVWFRNDSGTWGVSAWQIRFNCSQSFYVGGNIMSLLDYTDMDNATLTQGCFYNMFYRSTTIISAGDLKLPADVLQNSCYYGMFYNCTNLVSAPELPATTLAQYCYYQMFRGTGISTAPSLPATTLVDYCYYSMFQNCSNLITPPSLPATTMQKGSYREMFKNCTSLATAPTLSANIIAVECYYGMFQGCTRLATAPALISTSSIKDCYRYMFNGCTNLNDVTCYANSVSASNCIDGWLTNVAATGTFHKLGSATYNTGSSGIPSGWTIVNN